MNRHIKAALATLASLLFVGGVGALIALFPAIMLKFCVGLFVAAVVYFIWSEAFRDRPSMRGRKELSK